jgi:hypothetical protein
VARFARCSPACRARHTQAETDAARILAAVEQHVTRARPGRGLALYAAPGLWARYVLPVPIRNSAAYGTAAVLPMLDALDAYEAYGILIVDHERARMLVAYLGETTVVEDDTLELHRETWRFKAGRPPTHSRLVGVGAGRGAHAEPFEARIAHQQHGFWAGVARAADLLMRERRIVHLVISGSVEAAAEVRRNLPESRAQQVAPERRLSRSARRRPRRWRLPTVSARYSAIARVQVAMWPERAPATSPLRTTHAAGRSGWGW